MTVVLWSVTCSQAEVCQGLGGIYCLCRQETADFPEIGSSTTRRRIQEEGRLYTQSCEKLNYHIGV